MRGRLELDQAQNEQKPARPMTARLDVYREEMCIDLDVHNLVYTDYMKFTQQGDEITFQLKHGSRADILEQLKQDLDLE